MTNKKDFYKLAQLIKIAAKDVSKEEAWWKIESISTMLGFEATDEEPDILEVVDDSGYRAIVLGDIRGNVSYNTGLLNNSLTHKGYAYLYSDNCSYDSNNKRIWESGYQCFPLVKDIAKMLECIARRIILNNVKYFNGDDNNSTSLCKYLSEIVIKCANAIGKNKKTAQEIFDSYQ